MLIAHFSLYMKCFTKPLIGATLLAVWIFSFGWLVGHFYENWRVTPLRRNFRCRRCCRCGAPWGKIRTLSLARSSVTPGAGAVLVNSEGEIILVFADRPKCFSSCLDSHFPASRSSSATRPSSTECAPVGKRLCFIIVSFHDL